MLYLDFVSSGCRGKGFGSRSHNPSNQFHQSRIRKGSFYQNRIRSTFIFEKVLIEIWQSFLCNNLNTSPIYSRIMTLGSSPTWFIFWFVILQDETTLVGVISQGSSRPLNLLRDTHIMDNQPYQTTTNQSKTLSQRNQI